MLLMFAVIWVVFIPGGVVALAWAAAVNRERRRPQARRRAGCRQPQRVIAGKSLRRCPTTPRRTRCRLTRPARPTGPRVPARPRGRGSSRPRRCGT
jgi:hypothetical protein